MRSNIFSIRFKSGEQGGILNNLQPESIALHAILLFWEGSPSWRNNFPFGLAEFLNMSENSSSMKDLYVSELIGPDIDDNLSHLYCVQQLPWSKAFLHQHLFTFSCAMSFQTFTFLFHICVLSVRTLSMGLVLCTQSVPSK